MDCGFNCDYNSLINELTQGLEYVKQLRASNNIQELDFHMQMILFSFEKSLSILNWNGSVTQTPLLIAPPESSISVEENPRSDDQDFRYVSKKRLDDFLMLMITQLIVSISEGRRKMGFKKKGCNFLR